MKYRSTPIASFQDLNDFVSQCDEMATIFRGVRFYEDHELVPSIAGCP